MRKEQPLHEMQFPVPIMLQISLNLLLNLHTADHNLQINMFKTGA